MPKENPITRRGPGRAVWTLTLALALLAPAVCAANTTLTFDAILGSQPAAQDGSGTVGCQYPLLLEDVARADVLAFGNAATYPAVIGAGSGAAGTITVSGTVDVNTIQFNAPGSGNYTLSGAAR